MVNQWVKVKKHPSRRGLDPVNLSISLKSNLNAMFGVEKRRENVVNPAAARKRGPKQVDFALRARKTGAIKVNAALFTKQYSVVVPATLSRRIQIASARAPLCHRGRRTPNQGHFIHIA